MTRAQHVGAGGGGGRGSCHEAKGAVKGPCTEAPHARIAMALQAKYYVYKYIHNMGSWAA